MALAQTDGEIQGFDLADNNITQFLDNPRLYRRYLQRRSLAQ